MLGGPHVGGSALQQIAQAILWPGRGGTFVQHLGEAGLDVVHDSTFRIAARPRSIQGPTEPGAQFSASAISSVVKPA
jgi:hypothetical protein